MILIVSNDKDFSATLATHVGKELNFACEQAETIEKAGSNLNSATLIVTDSEIKGQTAPCLMVDEKPVRLREVLARIHRAAQKTEVPVLNFGKEYGFIPQQKQLKHASGKSASLTDKEAQILQLMIASGKKTVSKEELLKTIGFEADLNTHTLETHIYRLRGKFKELSGSDAVIEATDGGYRLAV